MFPMTDCSIINNEQNVRVALLNAPKKEIFMCTHHQDEEQQGIKGILFLHIHSLHYRPHSLGSYTQ
jgi:hypothetical protein